MRHFSVELKINAFPHLHHVDLFGLTANASSHGRKSGDESYMVRNYGFEHLLWS